MSNTDFLSQPGTPHKGMQARIPIDESVRRLLATAQENGRNVIIPIGVGIHEMPLRRFNRTLTKLHNSAARPMKMRAANAF